MKLQHINKLIKIFRNSMTRGFFIGWVILGLVGCNNYLDVTPDNIANLDHVFANQKEGERYLATLYSYAPLVHSADRRSLTFFGADDVWSYTNSNNYDKTPGIRIAMGQQNANAPYENYWDGDMFKAIRDCNTFLEEISKTSRIPEMSMALRKRWIAEANFLKAYYHFILFRMYGPIPIIDKNLSVGSDVQDVLVKRNTVDEVEKYISGLLDSAAADLPQVIENAVEESGRVTKGAAFMLQAKLWVTAASPLFNGNPDYKGIVDYDGVPLFAEINNPDKWTKAVAACEAALANLPSVELYRFRDIPNLSERNQLQMNLRGAVTDRFNREIIWGRYISSYNSIVLQAEASVPQMIDGIKNSFQSSAFSVTMNMVERFYTKNGVPIDEDKTWDYAGRYQTSVVSADQNYNLMVGYTTANMNQQRENRFYASLMFDGSVVFMKNTINENNAHKITTMFTDRNGAAGSGFATVTGYWIRKLINWEYTHSPNGAASRSYAWPEMRLADMKLLYAEALNEVGRSDEAIAQLDEVRERSGLKGILVSWNTYSKFPNKPNTQDGLREIIHQEREIELAFEGSRIWDIRRWKKAADYQNKDVRGWNVVGKNAGEYYQLTKVFVQSFIAPRDYLWPISLNALTRNSKLVQNPGW